MTRKLSLHYDAKRTRAHPGWLLRVVHPTGPPFRKSSKMFIIKSQITSSLNSLILRGSEMKIMERSIVRSTDHHFKNKRTPSDFMDRQLIDRSLIQLKLSYRRTEPYLNLARAESSQSHKVRFMVVKPKPEVMIELTSGYDCDNHSDTKLFSAWLVMSTSREFLRAQCSSASA